LRHSCERSSEVLLRKLAGLRTSIFLYLG